MSGDKEWAEQFKVKTVTPAQHSELCARLLEIKGLLGELLELRYMALDKAFIGRNIARLESEKRDITKKIEGY